MGENGAVEVVAGNFDKFGVLYAVELPVEESSVLKNVELFVQVEDGESVLVIVGECDELLVVDDVGLLVGETERLGDDETVTVGECEKVPVLDAVELFVEVGDGEAVLVTVERGDKLPVVVVGELGDVDSGLVIVGECDELLVVDDVALLVGETERLGDDETVTVGECEKVPVLDAVELFVEVGDGEAVLVAVESGDKLPVVVVDELGDGDLVLVIVGECTELLVVDDVALLVGETERLGDDEAVLVIVGE